MGLHCNKVPKKTKVKTDLTDLMYKKSNGLKYHKYSNTQTEAKIYDTDRIKKIWGIIWILGIQISKLTLLAWLHQRVGLDVHVGQH